MKHVIITDRNAPDALIEAADLVTEITMVKHPFRSGVKAQRGSNCDAARPLVRRWLLPAVRGLAALAPRCPPLPAPGAGRRRTGRPAAAGQPCPFGGQRSEEHTSELQSLMRISYAVFCLKK